MTIDELSRVIYKATTEYIDSVGIVEDKDKGCTKTAIQAGACFDLLSLLQTHIVLWAGRVMLAAGGTKMTAEACDAAIEKALINGVLAGQAKLVIENDKRKAGANDADVGKEPAKKTDLKLIN